jgi:hypothetical protein
MPPTGCAAGHDVPREALAHITHEAVIGLQLEAEGVEITMDDDGRGLDPSDLARTLGPLGCQRDERAHHGGRGTLTRT